MTASAQNAVPPAPTPPRSAPKTFGISDSAAARIKALLAQRNTPAAGLRVAVRGGGCSGLAYVIEWAESPRERDKIFEKDGIRVFVDPKSFIYLTGMVLDFEETLMRQVFNFINPNSTKSCGCGSSFSS